MSACAVCGQPVATTGNTLDGYTTHGNLCDQHNRDELRTRGLEALADQDQRNARTADLLWKTIGVALLALIAIIALGALVS